MTLFSYIGFVGAGGAAAPIVQAIAGDATLLPTTDILQVSVGALGNVNVTLPSLGQKTRMVHKIAGGVGTITLVRTAAQIAAGTKINGVVANYVLVNSSDAIVTADDVARHGWFVYDNGVDFFTA